MCFAKRNNKWIVFDWGRILTNLSQYFDYCKVPESDKKKSIKELYCTLLDISFSHTGGCIALILSEMEEEIEDVINERIDIYSTTHNIDNVREKSKEKIEILNYLLSNSNNELQSFFDIERVLRKEISGLDGAIVMSIKGNFYCVGSIIQVPAGSDGGGRTAAAKRLAKLGIGIKISEDGYIEAYGYDLNTNIDNDNDHIIHLFRFK